ncbi:hypothetical protein [Candidatus Vidania fulgoroideorum]
MRDFYYFFYNKNIKEILKKCKKILIYGKRDFFKIRISIFSSYMILNKKKNNITINIILKKINKKKNIRIFTCNKNYNFSLNTLKTIKFKNINEKIVFKNINFLKKDLKKKNSCLKKKVNIIYCIENLSLKSKNFLIKILDKNLKDYFIFITFNDLEKNCPLLSRLYKIKSNDCYKNLELLNKKYNNYDILIRNFLKKKIKFKCLIKIKKNIVDFLCYFIYFITSRKNIVLKRKIYIIKKIKKIIKSKNNKFKLTLLFFRLEFYNGFL